MVIDMSSVVDASIALLGAIGILVMAIGTLSLSDIVVPPNEAVSRLDGAVLTEKPPLPKAA